MFRFLQRCSESGRLDLRNVISHGFVDEVHAPIAALLTQVLLFLSSLETTARTASGDPDPDPEYDSDLAAREGDPGGDDSDPEPGRSPGEHAPVREGGDAVLRPRRPHPTTRRTGRCRRAGR
jgi:hypothetical protein